MTSPIVSGRTAAEIDAELNRAFREVAITHFALINLLIEKGVFSLDEWEAMRARCVSAADQEFERRDESERAEFRAANPDLAAWHQLFGAG